MKNILYAAGIIYLSACTYAVYKNSIATDLEGDTRLEKKVKELTQE